MDANERNKIVEQCQNMAWWTIHRNRRLIIALRMEDEDVFQNLMIALMKAVEEFDASRGSFTSYILHQLQYEILRLKRQYKPYGLTSIGGERPEVISLDYIYEDGYTLEIPIEDDFSGIVFEDAMSILTPEEYEVITLQMEGINLRKNIQKNLVNSARNKLENYFAVRKDSEFMEKSTA